MEENKSISNISNGVYKLKIGSKALKDCSNSASLIPANFMELLRIKSFDLDDFPVLFIKVPKDSTKGFPTSQILSIFGNSCLQQKPVLRKSFELIKENNIKLIIIDELSNLNKFNSYHITRAFELIITLSRTFQIPVILNGLSLKNNSFELPNRLQRSHYLVENGINVMSEGYSLLLNMENVKYA